MDSLETEASDKQFNVLQIIALNTTTTVLLVLGLLAADISVGLSLLIGWIGGSMLTSVGLVMGVYLKDRRAERNLAAATSKRPKLVPADITDPLQLWEEDRLLEIDYLIDQADRQMYLAKSHGGSELSSVRLPASTAS